METFQTVVTTSFRYPNDNDLTRTADALIYGLVRHPLNGAGNVGPINNAKRFLNQLQSDLTQKFPEGNSKRIAGIEVECYIYCIAKVSNFVAGGETVSEAYRTVRTNIRCIEHERNRRRIRHMHSSVCEALAFLQNTYATFLMDMRLLEDALKYFGEAYTNFELAFTSEPSTKAYCLLNKAKILRSLMQARGVLELDMRRYEESCQRTIEQVRAVLSAVRGPSQSELHFQVNHTAFLISWTSGDLRNALRYSVNAIQAWDNAVPRTSVDNHLVCLAQVILQVRQSEYFIGDRSKCIDGARMCLRTVVTPANHPDVLVAQSMLAWVEENRDEAVTKLIDYSERILALAISSILNAVTDSEFEMWMRDNSGAYEMLLSLVASLPQDLGAPYRTRIIERVLIAVNKWKVVQEFCMLKQCDSFWIRILGPASVATAKQICELRRQTSAIWLEVQAQRGSQPVELRSGTLHSLASQLDDQIRDLQSGTEGEVMRQRLKTAIMDSLHRVTIDNVLSCLSDVGDGTTLMQFVYFRQFQIFSGSRNQSGRLFEPTLSLGIFEVTIGTNGQNITFRYLESQEANAVHVEMDTYVTALEGGDLVTDFPVESGRSLYTRLLAENGNRPRRSGTPLMVLPDGKLFGMPLHALVTPRNVVTTEGYTPDAASFRFLIEDTDVCYINSLSDLLVRPDPQFLTGGKMLSVVNLQHEEPGFPEAQETILRGNMNRQAEFFRDIDVQTIPGPDVLRAISDHCRQLYAVRARWTFQNLNFEEEGTPTENPFFESPADATANGNIVLSGETVSVPELDYLLVLPDANRRFAVLYFDSHGNHTENEDAGFIPSELRSSKSAATTLYRAMIALSKPHLWSVGEIRDRRHLFANDVMKWDLTTVSLVVLSACTTGTAYPYFRDVAAGFRQAFRIAGARGVIGPVGDVDSSDAIQLFRFLRDETDSAPAGQPAFRLFSAAVRRYISAFRRPSDPNDPHKSLLWTPLLFVFCGQPGATIPSFAIG